MSAPRSASQRKVDTLTALQAKHADVWVSTAGADAVPYLVPLSFAWVGERVVIAVEPSSRTACNLQSGRARLGFGPTRDVVMMDAEVEAVVPEDEAAELADAYAAQADWDPRDSSAAFVYITLRPTRVQAWREADEIAGRTLMTGGSWLV